MIEIYEIYPRIQADKYGSVDIRDMEGVRLSATTIRFDQFSTFGNKIVYADTGDEVKGLLFASRAEAVEYLRSLIAPHERRIQHELEIIEAVKSQLEDEA